MFIYKPLKLADICHQTLFSQVELFELSLTWLMATEQFMLASDANVIVHCLVDEHGKVNIAWPLVHQTKANVNHITSLTSFYSATSQIYTASDLLDSKKTQLLQQLLASINHENYWHQMLLGPIDEKTELASSIEQTFNYQRVYSQSINFFENNIANFEHYYADRPSQLRNTIRRREKKLAQAHQYHIEIIASKELFDKYFVDYQTIYQQSWKGEEYSFEFIEQVCLTAISKNQLRMGMLFVDNQPAAVQLWFIQAQIASIFKLAYSPQYQEFSVGSILSMALSKHVIEQDRVTAIEFGMGNERYKKDWMSKQRQRIVYQVFNHRTLRGNLAAIKYLLLVKIKRRLMALFR